MQYNDEDLFLQPKVQQYGSHMVMTNMRGDIKKKYWNIDTQFRDDYQEYTANQPTQYTFTLPQSINNVKSIRIVNLELPLTFYNISTTLNNNVISIEYGGTTYSLVITDGYYNITTLISEINTRITATTLNGKINFSAYGNFVKINTLTNGTYIVNFAVGINGTTPVLFDKFNVKSKLGWYLGFRQISYTLTDTGSRISIQSECFSDINHPRYIYLVCDDFVTSNPNSFISALPSSILAKNILAKITLNMNSYAYGSIFPANTFNGYLQSDKREYAGNTNLQRLKIQLVNEYGNPITLNGADFSFCIVIEYEG